MILRCAVHSCPASTVNRFAVRLRRRFYSESCVSLLIQSRYATAIELMTQFTRILLRNDFSLLYAYLGIMSYSAIYTAKLLRKLREKGRQSSVLSVKSTTSYSMRIETTIRITYLNITKFELPCLMAMTRLTTFMADLLGI